MLRRRRELAPMQKPSRIYFDPRKTCYIRKSARRVGVVQWSRGMERVVPNSHSAVAELGPGLVDH